jgi:NADH-quinone oxidoreductase E subunit
MGHLREPAPENLQPGSFSFTAENLAEAEKIIAKYPQGREQSAVMPLLSMAQRQHDNWLPRAAIEHVAEMCNMPYIRAYEVATFYTMYNLAPVGKHHIQCCTTTPCWLRGSDEVLRACKDELGITPGHKSADGNFELIEVECLGACVNAPMVQVTTSKWDRFYEDLTYDNTRRLLQKFKRGEAPPAGSQAGRNSSEPKTGPTTLETQRKLWEEMKA